MNDTIKKPIIQEMPSSHNKEQIQKAVAETYGEKFANDGFFILGSGIPSFIQTRKTETISIIRDFGTKKKPRKKRNKQ